MPLSLMMPPQALTPSRFLIFDVFMLMPLMRTLPPLLLMMRRYFDAATPLPITMR